MAHVFTSTRSAPSAAALGRQPARARASPMRCESDSFIWQPKVWMKYLRATESGDMSERPGRVNGIGLDSGPRRAGVSRAMRSLAAALLAFASAASAEGLDRDTLLTDAPAVPAVGTVRLTGAGVATQNTDNGATPTGSSSFTGSIGWTPIANLHGDVGAYFQVGAQGPAARIRYQLLNQFSHGLDLATGIRFKTVGFHPDQGEVEFLLAAGRRFGRFEVVLNGVFGVETGGEQGKDVEAKAFAGWRLSEAIRAGIDGRLQAEIQDEARPATTATGRDYDLTAGPAVSWMVSRTFQLQALFGVAQPKKSDKTSPAGVLSASLDF